MTLTDYLVQLIDKGDYEEVLRIIDERGEMLKFLEALERALDKKITELTSPE